MPRAYRLSKTRFLAGLQCHKQLWWRVHEPTAPELVPDPAQQAVFDQGTRVGEVARTYVPGGELVDLPHNAYDRRVETTRQLLNLRVPAIYEASFKAGGAYAAVDILERDGDRFHLVEVKSSTRLKDEHLPDVAVQLHVLRESGLDVARAELMHLNRACAYPRLEDLFVREDVTAAAEAWQPKVREEIPAQSRMLAGPLPDVPIGEHCRRPYDCPFLARCWPPAPAHHVGTLYRVRDGGAGLLAQGYETIAQLPPGGLTRIQERQRLAVVTGRLVVEPGLAGALRALDGSDVIPRPAAGRPKNPPAPPDLLADPSEAPVILRPAAGRPKNPPTSSDSPALEGPIAFLDFETVALAIPAWEGCHPYDNVPVQFSCHVREGGRLAHHEWIADGPGDPRPELARRLVAACRGARTVVAYNAAFERAGIESLAAAVPGLADDLLAIAARLADLLPIVRDHVYHPDFGGSFSLKAVRPALVPGAGYEGLEVAEGATASRELERLMFRGDGLPPAERERLRSALLRYCAQDTMAMVELLDRLRELA